MKRQRVLQKMIQVRVSDSQLRLLQAKSATSGTTRSVIVRELIEQIAA